MAKDENVVAGVTPLGTATLPGFEKGGSSRFYTSIRTVDNSDLDSKRKVG
jgi:hypothetical protein